MRGLSQRVRRSPRSTMSVLFLSESFSNSSRRHLANRPNINFIHICLSETWFLPFKLFPKPAFRVSCEAVWQAWPAGSWLLHLLIDHRSREERGEGSNPLLNASILEAWPSFGDEGGGTDRSVKGHVLSSLLTGALTFKPRTLWFRNLFFPELIAGRPD